MFVPKYGIEGPVYLTAKEDKAKPKTSATTEADLLLDEEKQTVKSRDGTVCYTVRQISTIRHAQFSTLRSR